MRHRRTLIILGCVLIPAAVYFGQFESTSVCTTCGEAQSTREFQIPFTRFTYFATRSRSATPLSAAINRAGLVPATHSHQWLFANGGGNGIMCALGSGRHVRDTANFPAVATFVTATVTYRGQSAAQPWLAALLDPNRTSDFSPAISSTAPLGGCPTQAVYDRWRRDVGEVLDVLAQALPP